MNLVSSTFLTALGLLLGMVLMMEVGRRVGVRRLAADPQAALSGTGAVGGAVFGLLGLLVAFTFSGAAARCDARRELIVSETNAIGTAYLRLDLLPESAQAPLRDLFRQYVDCRIETYRKLPDLALAKAELARSAKLQGEIWRRAVAAGKTEGSPTSAMMLVVPALNEMFDITTTRMMATELHPPSVVFVLLFGLALATALLAGFDMSGRKSLSWLHVIGFAAVTASAVYVISDMEYPRLGLLRVEAFDHALVDLRATMK
jgi:hypothetical protein